MESRVNKYYASDITNENTSLSTRSSRNANLYRELNGKYGDLDNLPIEDNTNEIDMAKLKELVLSNNSTKEVKQLKEDLNILEQRKRRIDEQKLYDINKILEKAKYENSKLKVSTTAVSKPRQDLLATLRSTELSLDEINEAKKHYQEKIDEIHEKKIEEELSMTRELKYKNLSMEYEKEEISEVDFIGDTNSLSLDLFEELKPTGNTIITKPIKSDTVEIKAVTEKIESDIHSGDTRDIDIIKGNTNNSVDDFFTSSYEFSKKDFADVDDEFFDEPKKSGLFKIVLLVFAIFVFIGVIIYFVGTYGLGIS